MENKKKYTYIFAYCIFYFAVVIFGGAVNAAANIYQNQQFGHFLQNFIGNLYGVFVFVIYILLFVAIKGLKNKEIKLSDTVVNFLLAGVMAWVILGGLSSFIGYIDTACSYNDADITYRLSDYEKGSLTITCLNFAAAVTLFVMLKFWNTIGDYFKGFGGRKVVKAENAEGANLGEESATAVVEDAPKAEEKAADEKPVDADKID